MGGTVHVECVLAHQHATFDLRAVRVGDVHLRSGVGAYVLAIDVR
jgi:hypothetical protein